MIFITFYKTVLEALFPLSKAEQALLDMSPEEAYERLPPSPATPIGDTYSVFAYADEMVSKLVWQIKYMKSAKAISIGAYALSSRLAEIFPDQQLILIPIPITKQRRRERGFNQCELLVGAIKKLDTTNRFTDFNDLLIRTQHSSRQTLKNREERLESTRGIFSVDEKVAEKIQKGSAVVVIDDVITTGSTMKEAIETIRKIDLLRVYGISLAH